MSALDHSLRLARIDIRRMLRTHLNWGGGASSLVSVAIYVVMVALGGIGGGYLGYRVGDAFLAGSPDLGQFTPLEAVRGVFAIFWLMATLVYVIRTVGQRGTLPQPEGILTVVPTSQALVGVLLAEIAFFLLWILPPAAGVGVGMSIGTASVWPALAIPIGATLAGIGAVGIGYTLGLAIRHVASRFAFVARHKTAIIGLVVVAYFAALVTGAWDRLMVRLFDPLRQSPIGWYADVMFTGAPAFGASANYALGAVALTGVLATVAVVGGGRLARAHWFSDPVLAGTEPDEPVIEDDRRSTESWLAPAFGAAETALITLSWRRARRSPLKLLYAFYPLLVSAGLLAGILRTGQIPAYLPYLVLLFSAWAAGVIFTLNPLGDQGSVLPTTLLTPVDGRTFVRSLITAGLLVAVPLGTVATAAVAYLSPVSNRSAIALVVASPAVMLVSAVVSVGIGMAFPRFEATTVTRSMKTVLPSPWAFGLYTLYLVLTASATAIAYEAALRQLLATLTSWILPSGWEVPPDVLYIAAVLSLVPLALAPLAAYRYGVKRFDRYTLD